MLRKADLTSVIIGAAIEVHKVLGPGYIESVYEEALAYEFELRGIPFARQLHVPVLYEDRECGPHRLDMLVFDQVVVELKAVTSIAKEHFAKVRSYMCAARCRLGLILNFAPPALDVRRVFGPKERFLGSWVP